MEAVYKLVTGQQGTIVKLLAPGVKRLTLCNIVIADELSKQAG